jgi:hypothetical protein
MDYGPDASCAPKRDVRFCVCVCLDVTEHRCPLRDNVLVDGASGLGCGDLAREPLVVGDEGFGVFIRLPGNAGVGGFRPCFWPGGKGIETGFVEVR